MKPQLHASAIGMFFRCGEQFRRRYIEGERRPPGVAAAVGTATHGSIEADMRAKLTLGSLLADDAIADTARDGVARLFAGELDLAGETKGKDDLRGEAQDKAVRLARLHHAEAAPRLDPVTVEREFALDLGEGLPFDLAGRIDLEVSAGLSVPTAIHDAKTTARAPDPGAAETSLQLAAYSLAKKTLDGAHASLVALDYLVDARQPRLVQLGAVVTAEREQALIGRLRTVGAALTAGVFAPAPPDAWWCSARFCGYHATCPYVTHPHTTTGKDGDRG